MQTGLQDLALDCIQHRPGRIFRSAIYSDDYGETWQLGGTTPQDQVNECVVAEGSQGQVLLNMRNYDRDHKNRKIAHSEDGGLSWSNLESDDTLIEPICQASLIANGKRGKKHRLYFSNPASQSARTNMTLRMSTDDGQHWAKSQVIHPGPAAYSDLVMLNKRQIGILYEGGLKSAYEGIAFEVVDVRAWE